MFVPKLLEISLLVCIIFAQEPDCQITGNANDFAFLLDATKPTDLKICDQHTNALIAPATAANTKYVAHNCQYMPQGAPARKVVRRISVSGGQFSEWEVCTDQAGSGEDKFDIKVCQVGQACRLKEDIASFSTIQNRQTTSCSDLLTDLLKNNRQQYVRLFDSRTNPCDFSILAPNLINADDITSCKFGKYNNVFYELDVPTYCVVNHLGEYKNKCVKIDSLYEALKQFNNKVDRGRGAHNPQEYKRYLLQARMKIHTPNGVDRYNGNAAEHKASGFKTLFSNAVALLSTIHPEVHQVKFDDGQSFGADTFCTVALSQFPVDDDVLFGKVAVESCYFPSTDSKFSTLSAQQCLPFDIAGSLLGRKNSAIQGPWSIQRRNYLAGLLRVYNHLKNKKPFVSPNNYFWNQLLQRQTPMETILKDIETALGYTDDPRHTFTITNSKTSLAIATKIEMSAHAFCAAILELVPFKKEDMEKSMTSC